jgi:Spy/CpxP family protein refolding chaperone
MKRIVIFIAVALIAIGSAATLLAQTSDETAPPAGDSRPGPDNPPFMMGGRFGGPMGGHGMGMMPGMMQGRGRGQGSRGECNMLGCNALDLNDDQTAKIKDLNFTHRNKMIDLQASLEKAQLKMRHEMRADSPIKTAVLAAAKEVNTVKGQIAEARINHQFDLRGVLTADQLKTWDDFRGNCRGGFGKGMWPGSGMGQGFGHGDMQRKRDGSCVKGK